jgi:hypothetical protein
MPALRQPRRVRPVRVACLGISLLGIVLIGATLNIDVGPQAYYVLLAGSGLALAGLASYLYF